MHVIPDHLNNRQRSEGFFSSRVPEESAEATFRGCLILAGGAGSVGSAGRMNERAAALFLHWPWRAIIEPKRSGSRS